MALAMHHYHGEKGALPPAAVLGRDGKPLLSWRVLILPYIEQEDRYKEFRLDQPWDSPHNIQLLPRMPKLYAPFDGSPTPQPHTTYYQVFVGPRTAFEGPRGLNFADFKDGTSNTLLIVEAGEA